MVVVCKREWEAIHLARTTYYNLHTVFRDLSLGTLQSPRSCAHLCLLSQKMEIIRLKISEYILEVIWHPQTWSSTNLVLHYNIKVTKYFPSSLLVKMVCEYPTNLWNSMVESIQQIWLLNPSGKLFFVSFDFREVWWLISINQFDKNIAEIIAIMT